jgi:peptide chain release factor 1
MFDKLASVEGRYEELMASLGTSTVQNDPAEYRKQAKSLSEIEPLVEKYREYKGVANEIAQAEELAKGADADMRALAEEELSGLTTKRDQLVSELKVLLLPKDPNDEKNVIV